MPFMLACLSPFDGDPPTEPVQEEPPLFDDKEEVLQPEEILRHEENILRSGKSATASWASPPAGYGSSESLFGSPRLQVSAQGLGCMGMSAFYAPLIHHAVDSGITFLDTSDVYGPFTKEILQLGKAIKGMRRKCSLPQSLAADLRMGNLISMPMEILRMCGQLVKLASRGLIWITMNLYYKHRVDTKAPIEVTVRPVPP
ncbi:hypothetical protein L7F22_054689 [Adiantum nelumboides]|nr:hypothetical protein [Adiantum nelumboides]